MIRPLGSTVSPAGSMCVKRSPAGARMEVAFCSGDVPTAASVASPPAPCGETTRATPRRQKASGSVDAAREYPPTETLNRDGVPLPAIVWAGRSGGAFTRAVFHHQEKLGP